ncbi:MAG: hypothetical protein IPN90_11970 [Elusimicrobia bacterium]|nr:hypothetical protein [Elusimicrobiota bacterium]
MKRIIVDSAPLILLEKLSLLDEVGKRFHLVVPLEVAQETTYRKDLADARSIDEHINNGRLKVINRRPERGLELRNKWNLGAGEAAVLVMAVEMKAVILTDDFAAMRVAKALSVPFVTTVDILVELNRKKFLSPGLTRAKLMELKKHAWISPQFIAAAIKQIEKGS